MVTAAVFMAIATLAACDMDKNQPSGTPRLPVLALPPHTFFSRTPPTPTVLSKNWTPSSQLSASSTASSLAPLLSTKSAHLPAGNIFSHPTATSSSSSSSFSLYTSSSSPLSTSSAFSEEVKTTVISVSESQEEDNTTLPLEPPRPYLAHTSASIRVHLGATAKLDCVVHDSANEAVSWLRRDNDHLELLTWADNTYTNDDRFSVVQEEGDGWRLWRLEIHRAQEQDQGDYRCQVATHPPLLLDASLTVDVPIARVVDERGDQVEEKHYNSGSMIELKCIVEQVPFPHGPVTWRRGATILTFNTSRGGISVRGERDWGFVRSRLYVARARPSDSGRYSCCYTNTTCDSVTVHVIAGEYPAAMQHDTTPEATPSSISPSPHPRYLHLRVVIGFLTCVFSWRAT
ncbi:basement membrane-specific heparan sulfate proteoglycan core protein-like [Portunus trituberculatus]|uniref:basement membrane-specific heparan sulfate proteoglycan core protein-like n=1 Tax=Portunus trituberculatus TaxID=210409 RepID=UPI001E1CDB4B|nr:basement membrane-specific heparan sulfate proteoglycan core protein-like [Portunus trituberculatus]